jgi:hypothetical protein
MTPTQRALKALREAKESGRGSALILLMLERKPSAFYDCWRELNKGDKKPVVPESLRKKPDNLVPIRYTAKYDHGEEGPFTASIPAKEYICRNCKKPSGLIGVGGYCPVCSPGGFAAGRLNTEVIENG